jgi:ferric-dicitrate binding protein FerR (iron transport regulator)
VKKGETSVTVLGTHFNVNGYDDDDELKITLLEGSVRVSRESGVSSRESATLKPGEQARITDRISRIAVNSNADTEEVMAWKNGKFNFGEGATIETIMKQLARWYDVDIKYESKVNIRYGGTMSRNITISDVLKNIEKTGGVHFTIEGRTVSVKP